MKFLYLCVAMVLLAALCADASVPRTSSALRDISPLNAEAGGGHASNVSEYCLAAEAEEFHWYLPTICALVVLCMLLAFVLTRYHLVYIPESAGYLIIGVGVGAIVKYAGGDAEQQLTQFHYKAFFTLMLPPIIFDSGYSMKKRHFFRNFGSIILFAVIGTLISTAVVSFGLLYLGVFGYSYELPVAHAFMYGSLISAVDPVATLAVFAHVGAPEQLNSILAGESILNDAVAIVLFRTFETFTSSVDSVGTEVGMAILKFFYISVGSSAIGITMGLLFSLLTKHTTLYKYSVLETCILMASAYFTYLMPETITLSGIMALLFFGQVVAHYGFYNMATESKVTSRHMLKVTATLTETAIFVFLGLSLWSIEFSDFRWDTIGWTALLIVLGRILNVFPVSLISNCFRNIKQKITGKHQVIMAFCGLRGAIAFALAMNFKTEDPEMERVIVSTTIMIVLFTTFVFGAGTLPLMKLLGVSAKEDTAAENAPNPYAMDDVVAPKFKAVKRSYGTGRALIDDVDLEDDTTEEAVQFQFVDTPEKRSNLFSRLDQRYFKPFFIRAPEKRFEVNGTVNPKDSASMAEAVLAEKPELNDREEI